MLKYIQAIFLLLVATTNYAQNRRQTIDSLENVLKKTPDKNRAAVFKEIANEYRFTSGDTTIMYARKAINAAIKYKDRKSEAEGYTLISAIHKDRGEYKLAIFYSLKGLKISEDIDDKKGMATAYNGLGIIYKKQRRWDEALVYYNKANVLARRTGDIKKISLTYNNIGTIYVQSEEWETVHRYYDSALKYAEICKDPKALATVLGNMGDAYRGQKKFDKSIEVTKHCLEYDRANEDKYGMFMSYFQLARVYSEMKDFKQWQLYTDSAEKITFEAQLLRERIDLWSWTSHVKVWMGDTAAAFRYYQQARMINDTLLTEATAKQVSELQTQYETEKKEQKIALQQSELERKNIVIISICVLILLVLLLAYSFYNRYKLKQQSRLQQAVIREQELATEAVIAAEENERKRIAGDLHDGVGQLMSAARMNLSLVASEVNFENEEQKTAFEKALSLVDDSCKEVRAVSHNIMPNALLKAGLASAIRDFLHKIDHRVLEVNLYADGMNDRLPSNIEMVLYRVVQECVNNVIKHSGASKLDITLIKDEEGISITVEDNGKGFNPNEKQDDDSGIG